MEMPATMLLSGYGALEGPTTDDDGNLYFSDLRAGGVHRLRPSGLVDEMVPERRSVGGICLHADTGLVLSGADIVHVLAGRTRVVLDRDDVGSATGARAVGFNDLHADRQGRVFAGVLRRNDQDAPVPGELVMITAAGVFEVIHDDIHPNGIALSPDGLHLFAADTFRQRIIVFEAVPGGLPIPLTTFSTREIAGFPDGVATDEAGFIWVAFYKGGGVARFTSSGSIDRVIDLPAEKPLSLCFGGTQRSDLYVVTGTSDTRSNETGSVYRIPVGVRGTKVDVARI